MDWTASPANGREREEITRLLPLSDAAYQIALVLARRSPLHGYAIMKEISSWSHSYQNVGSGILHRTLPMLISQGLVEQTQSPLAENRRDRRGHKYYRITGFGVEICIAEFGRREYLIDAARTMLGKEKTWT